MLFCRFALALLPLLAAAQQPPGALQSANTQPTRSEDKCTVEGQVTNSLTGEPVRRAHITLQGMAAQNRSGYSAATDASGHFILPHVDPGQYQLMAARNGFVRPQGDRRGPNRDSMSLTLTPGQRVSDLALRLVPQGVITGRVLDEDGEPVEYVQVSTMQYRFFRGRRQFMPTSGGSTDDLGEFRIFGLMPGKYYLSATYRRFRMMTASDRTAGKATEEAYAATYFPGTTDPAGAVIVDVGPGASLNLPDLTLRKTRAVRIRGRIVNTMGEEQPERVMVRLMPRSSAMGFLSQMSAEAMRNQGGTFEFRGVTPGAYTLWAQAWDGQKIDSAMQPVDVGNSNIDDVSLALTPAFELKGQIRAEGNGDVSFHGGFVSLEAQAQLQMGGRGARLEDDHTFTLTNVVANKYTVNVRGLPENFYIKSIRMGDADGLDSGLDLTRGASGALDIVISPNGGQIEGSVSDPKQQPAVGAMVVLVPDERRREQLSLYKVSPTDQYGHFTIKGIAPGDYRLFAWQEVEMGAYMDPDFLKAYENDGEAVTIREGSRENRQLKLLPSDAASHEKAGN